MQTHVFISLTKEELESLIASAVQKALSQQNGPGVFATSVASTTIMWQSDSETIHQKAFYTPQEVAQILNIHYQTVLDYIKEGLIPAKRPSANRFLIAHQDLMAYMDQ